MSTFNRQQTLLFTGPVSHSDPSASSSNLNLAETKYETLLAQMSSLDIDDIKYSAKRHRKTSVICTIGPNTNNVEAICKLRENGMNIVRMNFSHGSFEFHQSIIDNVRKSFDVLPGRPVGIALDTKGPEIRTGVNKTGDDFFLENGSEVILTTDDAFKNSCTKEKIYVDYKNIVKVVKPGKHVYIDDGLVSLEVISTNEEKGEVLAKVMNSGVVGTHKGVNLPGTPVDLPALSEFDVKALQFGAKNQIDMIFASFIRKKADVIHIREVLGEEGKDIQIISKIENHEGMVNFNEILEVTDGIMVARGDLGIEIPPEKVFLAQKMMIARCNIVGKPVICATQMLESMTTNPRPTRAEVSDVANAVLDGADCVMLSGETAKGKYPFESVDMMAKICTNAESAIFYGSHFNEIMKIVQTPENSTELLACAAVNAAIGNDISAIIVLTTTGSTARLVSKYRPGCPILAVTRTPRVARFMHLYRGVFPLLYEAPSPLPPPEAMDESTPEGRKLFLKYYAEWQEDVDKRIVWTIEFGKNIGILKKGLSVMAIQGWKHGIGYTNTMRILAVE